MKGTPQDSLAQKENGRKREESFSPDPVFRDDSVGFEIEKGSVIFVVRAKPGKQQSSGGFTAIREVEAGRSRTSAMVSLG